MDSQALTTTDTTSRSLAVATVRLNDAIHDHVVTLATRNGSTTTPAERYVHFANATARAISLPKSDAKVIKALPIEDRATLALVREGAAARIPQWGGPSRARRRRQAPQPHPDPGEAGGGDRGQGPACLRDRECHLASRCPAGAGGCGMTETDIPNGHIRLDGRHYVALELFEAANQQS
jgi:hypothetical protein